MVVMGSKATTDSSSRRMDMGMDIPLRDGISIGRMEVPRRMGSVRVY